MCACMFMIIFTLVLMSLGLPVTLKALLLVTIVSDPVHIDTCVGSHEDLHEAQVRMSSPLFSIWGI